MPDHTISERLKKKTRESISRPISAFRGISRDVEESRRKDINRLANLSRTQQVIRAKPKKAPARTRTPQPGNLPGGVSSTIEILRRRRRQLENASR